MPHPSRLPRILPLAALVMLGAGVTTTDLPAQQRSQSPSSSDACGLITPPDAAAALGEAATLSHVTPNVSNAGTVASACEYEGTGYHKINLSLMRLPAAQVAMFRSMCADQKHDGLAGLGEVACWYQDKHEELHVMKGNAFINIQINRNGDPTAAIIAAMRKAVGRVH
jgi:hypothetical protein